MSSEHNNSSEREQRLHEVLLAYEEALEAGQSPNRQEWLARYPEFAAELTEFFANRDRVHRLVAPLCGVAGTVQAGPPPAAEGPGPPSPVGGEMGAWVADPAAAALMPTLEPAPGSTAPLPVGTRVRYIGDYELLEELGRGGMGVVYKARQQSLKRLVALKMILAGEHAGPHELARFRSEAEAVARLQHAHIVQIYEVGEHQGHPYFSLEFCPGGSLDRKLHGTPLPPTEAARLTATLAQAMHAAHQAGIVHRDLKPANVLLSADGTPRITDFGLAKKLDEGAGQTASGAILGTPSYMAPEQAGQGKAIGPAADVYALGAILYELLTGRPPFKAATPLDTVLQVVSDEPVPPRQLQPRTPRDLETICLKCLHKQPARRYATARELADDLERFLQGRPIAARPVGALERGWRWCRRNPVVAGLTAAVAGSLLLGLGLASLFAVEANRSAADALQQKDRADRNAAAAADNAHQAQAQAQQARREQQRAQDNERLARCRFHASQINLAQREWQQSHVIRVLELLEGLRPANKDEEDLRGFEWYYLQRLCHQDRLTLSGHNDFVWGLAFSPDGKHLASASKDQTVRIWDVRTGQEVRKLSFPGPVRSVCFSPNGTHVAAVGLDTSLLKVWQADTGQEVHSLRVGIYEVAYTPDGKTLATQGKGGVILIDAVTGREVRTLITANLISSQGLAISPDGKNLAVGCRSAGPGRRQAVVQVWDLATARVQFTLSGHEDLIGSVAFSPSGQVLATGSWDRTVRLWDAVTGKELRVLPGHTGDVYSLAFAPDGNTLAVANFHWPDADSGERWITVWDVHTGRKVRSLKGHTGTITHVGFSPDGQTLASGSLDGTVKLWDRSAGQEAITLQQNVENPPLAILHLAISPRGGQLAWADRRQVTLYDLRRRRVTRIMRQPATYLAFSADGQTLATALSWDTAVGQGREVQLWDTLTGRERRPLKGHTQGVWSVAFSADGNRLASAGSDQTVKIWDVATGREVWTLRGHAGTVYSVAFHPDGRHLASASEDKSVKIWDIVSGQEVRSLPGCSGPVMLVSYSLDGGHLASVEWTENGRGAGVGTVRVWETVGCREVQTIRGHTSYVRSLAFSPDGQRLATGSDDQTVKVWDVRTGQEMLTLRGHVGGVHGLVFTPDGRQLITADGDIPNSRSSTVVREGVALPYTVKWWDALPLAQRTGQRREGKRLTTIR